MRKWLLSMLLLLLTMPVAAQDFTAREISELTPFTLTVFDLQGVRPAAWFAQPESPGVFLRGRDPLDLTALLIQARPGTPDDLLADITTQFALDATPSSVETIETEFFTWERFELERQQNNQLLSVDFAMAQDDERVVFMFLQTPEIFYDNLHEFVFMPVLESVAPVQRYTDPDERFDVIVPSGWSLAQNEDFATITSPFEMMTLHVAAATGDDPIAAMQTFWQTVNPDFDETYSDDDVRVIEDAGRIGALESIVIVDWLDGRNADFLIKQGVARVYDGVIYMTLLETTVDGLFENEDTLSMIDRNFRITDLPSALDPAPESTAEANDN